MYCIPPSLEVTKIVMENFYFIFPFDSIVNIEYKGSLKLTVEKIMIEKVETLKKFVKENKLNVTFEHGFVSMKNSELLNRYSMPNGFK